MIDPEGPGGSCGCGSGGSGAGCNGGSNGGSHDGRLGSRRILEGLAELIYPTRCVVCERPGKLLCDDDKASLNWIDQETACSRCGAPYGFQNCTECTTRTGQVQFAFEAAASAISYDIRAQALVTAYKDENERRLSEILAEILADRIPPSWWLWADGLTWVPADHEAVQRRGFDHMRLLAEKLSALAPVTPFDLLSKQSGIDQRGLGRYERRDNAMTLFSLSEAASLADWPRRLLLVDDVFTTGATLNAAAMALISGGSEAIRTVTVARVW